MKLKISSVMMSLKKSQLNQKVKMLDYLAPALSIGVLLLMWFHTDFVIEYAQLFGLHDLVKLPKYDEVTALEPDLSYQDFLLEHYNCFFVRLITCPVCLAVWLSLVAWPITNVFFLTTTCLSLFVYLTLKGLLKYAG